MIHAARALQSHDLSGEGIKLWITDMEGPQDEWSAQCRGHLRDSTNMKDNTLSYPNMANMEWWLRRPNYIRGPWGPKGSWHSSYRWGKTPKKPHPGKLSRPGIEPGPAAWQARMLPLAPQRWKSTWRENNLMAAWNNVVSHFLDECVCSWKKKVFYTFSIMHCSSFPLSLEIYRFDYAVELNLGSFIMQVWNKNQCFLKTVNNDYNVNLGGPFNWRYFLYNPWI